MKKLVAIALLLIHLYNIGGQLLCYELLVYQSDKLFAEQINKNRYNTTDLTVVKIPVDMPGINDWVGYEDLSGQVKFKNASYNYVKLKVTRKALYLMCVPNYPTTHLTPLNIIDARQITDIPVPKKEHVPFGKINLPAYHYQNNNYGFSVPVTLLGRNLHHKLAQLPDAVISGPAQPPDNAIYLS